MNLLIVTVCFLLPTIMSDHSPIFKNPSKQDLTLEEEEKITKVIQQIKKENFSQANTMTTTLEENKDGAAYLLVRRALGREFDSENFNKFLKFVKTFSKNEMFYFLTKHIFLHLKANDWLVFDRVLHVAEIVREEYKNNIGNGEKLKILSLRNELEEFMVQNTSDALSRIMLKIEKKIYVPPSDIGLPEIYGSQLYKYDENLMEIALRDTVESMYELKMGPWIIQNVMSSFENLRIVLLGCSFSFPKLREQLEESNHKIILSNGTGNWSPIIWKEPDLGYIKDDLPYVERHSSSLQRVMKKLINVFFNETTRDKYSIIYNFTSNHMERVGSIILLKHMLRVMKTRKEYTEKFIKMTIAITKEINTWKKNKLVVSRENAVETLKEALSDCMMRYLMEVVAYVHREELVPVQIRHKARAIVDWTFIYSEELLAQSVNKTLTIMYPICGPHTSLQIITGFTIFGEVLIAFKSFFNHMKRDTTIDMDVGILCVAHTLQKITEEPLYLQIPLRYRKDISDIDNLSDIRKSLPLTVRNIVFEPQVCISNRSNKKYLAVNYSNKTYDNYRRDVIFYDPRSHEESQRIWVVELENPNVLFSKFSNKYYIKHKLTGEYLFLSVLDFDQDRRRLFTWLNKKKLANGIFFIEPHHDDAVIRNVQRNECLVVGTHRGSEMRTFSMKGLKNCSLENEALWKMESC